MRSVLFVFVAVAFSLRPCNQATVYAALQHAISPTENGVTAQKLETYIDVHNGRCLFKPLPFTAAGVIAACDFNHDGIVTLEDWTQCENKTRFYIQQLCVFVDCMGM
jgi:hypothetical protein